MFHKLVEILHVVSEFKTAIYFLPFKRHHDHAISRKNCTTIGATFLVYVLIVLSDKSDKDAQLGKEIEQDTLTKS